MTNVLFSHHSPALNWVAANGRSPAALRAVGGRYALQGLLIALYLGLGRRSVKTERARSYCSCAVRERVGLIRDSAIVSAPT